MSLPRSFPPPPDAAAPARIDAERALVALGDLAFACERQVLADVLPSWRRYAEACGQPPFLAVDEAALPSIWKPRAYWLGTLEDYQLLLSLALTTARHATARDAVWAWQAAREAFTRAALTTVRDAGNGVAAQLAHYARDGWKTPVYRMALRYCDEPDDDNQPLYWIPVSAIACDLLASSAARAAHLARFVLEAEGGAL
jgi:hypothetical protein